MIRILTALAFVPFLFLSGKCNKAPTDWEIVSSPDRITKAHLKISSEKGLKEITLEERGQLDSLTHALQSAAEIHPQQGGAFPIWADVHIWKGGKMADFMVQYSESNGWYVDLGEKTLRCDYLFSLVQNYAAQ